MHNFIFRRMAQFRQNYWFWPVGVSLPCWWHTIPPVQERIAAHLGQNRRPLRRANSDRPPKDALLCLLRRPHRLV